MKSQKLAGIFANESEAIEVIERLKLMGYLDSQISAITKNSDRLREFGDDTAVDVTNLNIQTDDASDAVIPSGGSTRGLMVNYGLFAIPGAEPFAARGPIAAKFTGTAATEALEEVAKSLMRLGIAKEDANVYKSYLDRGDVLIMVESETELQKNQVLKYYKDHNSLI